MNLRRLWSHTSVTIDDKSDRTEVIHVLVKSKKQTEPYHVIAFPAHSSYAIIQLLNQLSESLGYEVQENIKSIDIR